MLQQVDYWQRSKYVDRSSQKQEKNAKKIDSVNARYAFINEVHLLITFFAESSGSYAYTNALKRLFV